MPTISGDLVESVARQYLAYDYLLNGMFVCSSPLAKRIKKGEKEWLGNNTFDYYKYLSNSGTGGGIVDYVFNKDLSLIMPNDPVTGKYTTTYGTIMDGLNFDLNENLDTMNVPRAALINAFGLRIKSFRQNFSGMYLNALYGGLTGSMFRLGPEIKFSRPVGAKAPGDPIDGYTPTVGTTFYIKIPPNVANYGIKGKGYVTKTSELSRYGDGDAKECYAISIQKQEIAITALPGSTPTVWSDGQWIQRAGSRGLMPGSTWGFAADGVTWAGNGAFSTPATTPYMQVGFMRGIPELFCTDILADGTRPGLAYPFDGDTNRLEFSIDRAGDGIHQGASESIADAIFGAARNAQLAAPDAPWIIQMHPDCMNAMSHQENDTPMFVRNMLPSGPYLYHKGIEVLSFSVGGRMFNNVLLDAAQPTDEVYVYVDGSLEYNARNQAYAQIDQYIMENNDGKKPDDLSGVELPQEFTDTKIDWNRRLSVGSPQTRRGSIVQGFIHPSTFVPIQFEELGAFFCERPHLWTTLKLNQQIVDPMTA